jgi:hypothetical protein
MEIPSIMAKAVSASLVLFIALFVAVLSRILYMQKLHPLSKFPGPWYATSSSIVLGTISALKKEPDFFTYLVKKYGSKYLLWVVRRC